MTNDPSRWLLALAAVGLWLVLIGLIVWRERRAKAAVRARSEALAGDGEETVLVAFASQTGLAEELAWMTARALQDGGVGGRGSCRLRPGPGHAEGGGPGPADRLDDG